MAKKVVYIGLIIISIVFVLLLVVALGISPVAKSYIEKHSKELVGRKVLMKDLNLNIFTGTLHLDSIRLYEKDDTTIFASIDSFYVDVELTALLSSRIEVAQLRVVRPYTAIIQNGELFNFDDLMPKEDTASVATDPSSFPKSVLIRDIYVNGGKLAYTDLQINNTILMNDLGVAIPELAFERGNTNAGIHLKIGDSATLASKLVIDMQTNEYLLALQLENLPVDIMKPYMTEYFNIDKLEGTLSTDLQIKGNTEHLTEFTVSGTAKANGFNLTNTDGEPVLAINEAFASMEQIYLPTSTYLFDSIEVKGAKLDFIFHQDSTHNIGSLFKLEADTVATDTTATDPFIFKINKLHIKESELVYVDKTLRTTELNLPLSNVDFVSHNFDLDGTNKYDIKATVPNGGKIDFSWKANLNDMSNQEITGNFRNISLSLFTPYCLDYTAYDITKGNMNFTTTNLIQNNNIQSTNKIDIYNMRVGKKRDDLKPEYNVPLKLALYVLRDKDEKIEFDIPVKGNINDPQFSYKKIVLKTIVNLMVKVAVSPVRFLANTLGMNPDEMASMSIDALQTEINARQYSQLNELAGIYNQKPDMVLDLMQYVDWNQALEDYAMYQGKKSFLISRSSANNTNPTYEDVKNEIKDDDVNYKKYIDDLFVSKGGNATQNLSMRDKLYTIYPKDSIQNELIDQLKKRDEYIRNYLTATGGVPETNVATGTAAIDTLTQYRSRPQYKIELTLPEE